MKIALLSFEYPSETGFGGIGTYTWYQARALAKIGHDVHVLAGARTSSPLRSETHDGVTEHRFRADGVVMRAFRQLDRWELSWSKNRLENGWTMYRGLAALLDRHAFDVVEMPECGAEGWLLNRLLPAKTVVRFHSPAQLIMGSYGATARDTRLCSALERFAMTGAGALSSCSAFLKNEVQKTVGIRKHIEVIANGIDLELFDRETGGFVRDHHGIPEGRPMILFTGRMEPRKGIHLCPEIVGSILERRDVAFVFAGRDSLGYMSGTLLPEVRRRQLRGTVHYLGELSLRDVRACVRHTDVLFLPSTWENCPYSVLEAMAAGRAIVCTDQGGMPELIRHEQNGLLARNGDPGSYIDQLDRVLDDDLFRLRLGEAARRTAESALTDVHIAERTVNFYREAFGL